MEWLLLILGFALVLGTGFFVAVEFSMIAIDVPTVQRMVDAGDRGAEPLLRCLKSLSTQLSACQLGITLTTLLTGYVMDPAIRPPIPRSSPGRHCDGSRSGTSPCKPRSTSSNNSWRCSSGRSTPRCCP